MATVVIPPIDVEPWPTLAPAIIDWIEASLPYGPGDMAGERYKVRGDFAALLYRAYEIFPRGHELAGRRRFGEVVEDVRKGVGKTEHAAVVAIAEAAPTCPVRFDGWDQLGNPVGRPVTNPYIPMLAYTEEQAEDLAYAVVRHMLNSDVCELQGMFDVGLDRILVLDDRGREAGKIAPLAAAPDSRDGALTTWQHLDETHRMYRPRLKKAWVTMSQNVSKRRLADAWSMKSTTAPEPGQNSIAEDDRKLADDVAAGKAKAPGRLFYFRRECPQTSDFELPDVDDDTPANRQVVLDCLIEASGADAATWSADLHSIVAKFFDPREDRSYLERVWLNRSVQGSDAAFDVNTYRDDCEAPGATIKAGRVVVATFDGSVGGAGTPDHTALVLTDIETGLQVVAGHWAKPANAPDDWEVPKSDVDRIVDSVFDTYNVWRLYADPHRWGPWLDTWAGEHGKTKIVRFDTAKWARMAYVSRDFAEAIRTGEISHNGDVALIEHVGNARKIFVPIWLPGPDGEKGEQLYTIGKEKGSPKKIDLAICAALGRRGQLDAIASGVTIDDFKPASRGMISY